jgi:hypothetical protein
LQDPDEQPHVRHQTVKFELIHLKTNRCTIFMSASFWQFHSNIWQADSEYAKLIFIMLVILSLFENKLYWTVS